MFNIIHDPNMIASCAITMTTKYKISANHLNEKARQQSTHNKDVEELQQLHCELISYSETGK